MPFLSRKSLTSNELFAQKKNVGEETKLRYELTSIDRKHFIVNDSIKHVIVEIKTDLRNVRMSTGHSVMPPTPFRDAEKRHNLMGQILPGTVGYKSNTKTKISTKLATKNNSDILVINELQDSNNTHLMSRANMHEGSLVQDCDQNRMIAKSQQSTDDLYIKASVDEGINSSINKQKHVSSILYGQNSIKSDNVMNERHGNNSNDIEIGYLQGDLLQTPIKENSTYSLYNQESADGVKQYPFRSVHSSVSPVSRQISEILLKGDLKRKDYLRERSSIDVETLQSNFGINETTSKSKTQSEHKRQNDSHQPETHIMLRNTRERCRSCIERYKIRQSKSNELQKEPLFTVLPGQHLLDNNIKQSTAEDLFNLRQSSSSNKTPILSLRSHISTLQLPSGKTSDYTNTKNIAKSQRLLETGNCFSKARLNILSQPKHGHKRKSVFSKQTLKRDLDQMIEQHSRPRLTELEKQRLRVLESKVQMFLAHVQHTHRPDGMVHIPLREDVMKVDISHH